MRKPAVLLSQKEPRQTSIHIWNREKFKQNLGSWFYRLTVVWFIHAHAMCGLSHDKHSSVNPFKNCKFTVDKLMYILSSAEVSALGRWMILYSVFPEEPHITCAVPHTGHNKQISSVWNKLYLSGQQDFAFDLRYAFVIITACKMNWLLLVFFW